MSKPRLTDQEIAALRVIQANRFSTAILEEIKEALKLCIDSLKIGAKKADRDEARRRAAYVLAKIKDRV